MGSPIALYQRMIFTVDDDCVRLRIVPATINKRHARITVAGALGSPSWMWLMVASELRHSSRREALELSSFYIIVSLYRIKIIYWNKIRYTG